MAGFNAGSAVSKLDYTLEPFANEKGTIREPSDAMIGAFLEGLKQLYEDTAETDAGKAAAELVSAEITPERMLAALSDISGDDLVTFHGRLAGLFSELCSGKPSKDGLLAMPMRVRSVFYDWINNEVVNPEAGTAAGNGQVIRMPAAARG